MFTTREIAERLGVTPGAVWGLARRAGWPGELRMVAVPGRTLPQRERVWQVGEADLAVIAEQRAARVAKPKPAARSRSSRARQRERQPAPGLDPVSAVVIAETGDRPPKPETLGPDSGVAPAPVVVPAGPVRGESRPGVSPVVVMAALAGSLVIAFVAARYWGSRRAPSSPVAAGVESSNAPGRSTLTVARWPGIGGHR